MRMLYFFPAGLSVSVKKVMIVRFIPNNNKYFTEFVCVRVQHILRASIMGKRHIFRIFICHHVCKIFYSNANHFLRLHSQIVKYLNAARESNEIISIVSAPRFVTLFSYSITLYTSIYNIYNYIYNIIYTYTNINATRVSAL